MPWICATCRRPNEDTRDECRNCGRYSGYASNLTSDPEAASARESEKAVLAAHDSHRNSLMGWALSATLLGALVFIASVYSLACHGIGSSFAGFPVLVEVVISGAFIAGGTLVLMNRPSGQMILALASSCGMAVNVIKFCHTIAEIVGLRVTPAALSVARSSHSELKSISDHDILHVVHMGLMTAECMLGLMILVQVLYCVGLIRAMTKTPSA